MYKINKKKSIYNFNIRFLIFKIKNNKNIRKLDKFNLLFITFIYIYIY